MRQSAAAAAPFQARGQKAEQKVRPGSSAPREIQAASLPPAPQKAQERLGDGLEPRLAPGARRRGPRASATPNNKEYSLKIKVIG